MTTDSGDASFSFAAIPEVPLGHVVAATATDPDGDTSEFSEVVVANAPWQPTTPTVPGRTRP